MSGALVVHISHESEVGEARRAVARVAVQAGLGESKAGTATLLATELASNLVRHAQGGELLVQTLVIDGVPVIELIALDNGPGMADVERCMADGFSTAGTLGVGLGGVRRMASTFDVYSRPGWGSIFLARVNGDDSQRARERFEWGCVSLPVRGETECGDSWSVDVHEQRIRAMVADGLGHGPLAARAAQEAGRVFAESRNIAPIDFLAQAHRALGSTRGAAVSVAQGYASEASLSFAGVGNVAGAIVGSQEQRGLAAHNGTIGATLPRVKAFEYEWPEHALLVLHSDGLRSRWSLRDYPGLHARHPAIVAAALYKDFRRGNDDVTVLAARRVGS